VRYIAAVDALVSEDVEIHLTKPLSVLHRERLQKLAGV
jgi:hypothetical protein